MKRFIHLAAPLRNVGDNALILGMRNIFKDYKLELRPIRTTIIDRKLIEEINSKYDGLIIGGGGLLHAPDSIWKRDKDTSGTLIMLNTDNLKFLKKPLIIYGVGYNVFKGEKGLPSIAKKSILDMMNKAIHFSVRNDGSRERLAEFLGIDKSKILEVPDPGLYVNSRDSILSDLIEGKHLAIELAADRMNNRFNSKSEIDAFISNIKKFIHRMSYDYKCWLVPHCPIDDDFINAHFKGYNRIPLMLSMNEASDVMGFYSKMKVVIGQRGHGNICPFGIGTPIISLVSHPKNLGFMKNINFDDFTINVNNPNLSETLEKLVYMIDNEYLTKQQLCLKNMKDLTEDIIKNIKIYE